MSETNGALPPPDNSRGDGKPGRMGNGRFGPGNAFSRGNPLNRKMFHLRAVLLNAVDRTTIEQAARKMGELAAAGDVAACKLLFEYCLGRPVQGVEISGLLGTALEGPALVAVILKELEAYPAAKLAVAAAVSRMGEGDGHDA
jgi:hypothetical protein